MERNILNANIRGKDAHFSIFLYNLNLRTKSTSFMMEKTLLKESKAQKAGYHHS